MVICPLCEIKRCLSNTSQLTRHVQYVHYNGDNEYKCIVVNCGAIIKRSTNILKHFRTYHHNTPGYEFLKESDPSLPPFIDNLSEHIEFDFQPEDTNLEASHAEDMQINEIEDFNTIDNCIPFLKLEKKQKDSPEDQYCALIAYQKKEYNLTESAVLSIAKDWMNFTIEGLNTGI